MKFILYYLFERWLILYNSSSISAPSLAFTHGLLTLIVRNQLYTPYYRTNDKWSGCTLLNILKSLDPRLRFRSSLSLLRVHLFHRLLLIVPKPNMPAASLRLATHTILYIGIFITARYSRMPTNLFNPDTVHFNAMPFVCMTYKFVRFLTCFLPQFIRKENTKIFDGVFHRIAA